MYKKLCQKHLALALFDPGFCGGTFKVVQEYWCSVCRDAEKEEGRQYAIAQEERP